MPRIKNILVPVDFSDASKQALRYAVSWPTRSRPHCTCSTRRRIFSCGVDTRSSIPFRKSSLTR